MNPLQRMSKMKDVFSNVEKRIYDKIVNDPSYVTRSGIVGLSEWCGVSQPSITRFCKTIGYDKYADFKQDMYRYILSSSGDELIQSEKFDLEYGRHIQYHIHLLNDIDVILNDQKTYHLVDAIKGAGNIYLSGVSESGIPALLFEKKLRRLGIHSTYIEPSEINDIFYYGKKGDLLFVFSVRGPVRGNVLSEFFSRSDMFNGEVYLITMNENVKNTYFDENIVVLPKYALPDTSFFSPSIAFIYFIERIIALIAKT